MLNAACILHYAFCFKRYAFSVTELLILYY